MNKTRDKPSIQPRLLHLLRGSNEDTFTNEDMFSLERKKPSGSCKALPYLSERAVKLAIIVFPHTFKKMLLVECCNLDLCVCGRLQSLKKLHI